MVPIIIIMRNTFFATLRIQNPNDEFSPQHCRDQCADVYPRSYKNGSACKNRLASVRRKREKTHYRICFSTHYNNIIAQYHLLCMSRPAQTARDYSSPLQRQL